MHESRLMEGHSFLVGLNDICGILKPKYILVKSVYYFTDHTTLYTSQSYVSFITIVTTFHFRGKYSYLCESYKQPQYHLAFTSSYLKRKRL
jgi:hypothetical protein